jgi:hypothetical protein
VVSTYFSFFTSSSYKVTILADGDEEDNDMEDVEFVEISSESSQYI